MPVKVFSLSAVILLTLFQAEASHLANDPGAPACAYSLDGWLLVF